jgi:hypothetical protein
MIDPSLMIYDKPAGLTSALRLCIEVPNLTIKCKATEIDRIDTICVNRKYRWDDFVQRRLPLR